MIRIALLAVTALAFTGCSENELGNLNAEDVGGRIEVMPPQIQFGTLQDGETDIKTFQIENIGDSALRIDHLELAEPGSFVLVDAPTDFLLPEGAVQEVEVLFTPLEAYENTAKVTVFSDDPVEPEQHVDLLGVGAVPELVIDPAVFDFGADFVGCGDETTLTLSNVGSDDLVIESFAYDDPTGQLTLDNPNVLPMVLTPGSNALVFVDYASTTQAVADGTLTVTSNDPRGDIEATQTAEGVYATVLEEQFEVPVNPPVDILFAVDQSCSMDGHSDDLGPAFSELIDEISTVTSGWQIGVSTIASGCFNSGILRSTTPNVESLFNSAVSYGGAHSNTEKLFSLTLDALGASCNAGFLRPDALLHVVLVSDEWEQSGMAPSTFVSQVRQYKNNVAGLVKVSGIICEPQGCGHNDSLGPRDDDGYAEAVQLTGGLRMNVMADSGWGAYAQQLAAASLTSIHHYELDQPAHPSSIRVWVDGVEWTTGWHFDAAANEVVFDDAPDPGAQIDVEYGVAVPCN